MSKCLTGSRGLTLVELLIVVVIVAILTQIALPDLSGIIKNNRGTTQLNELQTSLNLARSEAVKRNSEVVVCKSSNGTGCTDSGVNWHAGWLVFEDRNSNDAVDTGEPVLSVNAALSSNTTLKFTPARVVYVGTGLASEGLNGTYTLCDDRGPTHAKGIIIGPGGRPRLARDTNSNGIPEDAGGTDLTCS